MKRLLCLVVLLAAQAGCATLGFGGTSRERSDLWLTAHSALNAADFVVAEAAFQSLANLHGETQEGRESLFYLGSIKLDPRNPTWSSGPAEVRLGEYLALAGTDGPQIMRYAEAQTLYEIARQLNLPAESRVAGLQPEERVVTVQERVVVPAAESRELSEQVGQLRQQIAERDARIREQQEELERIRRTLTGTPRQP
jgi:hypothetical protein